MVDLAITIGLVVLAAIVGLTLLLLLIRRLSDRGANRLGIVLALGMGVVFTSVVLYVCVDWTCGPWSAEAAIGDWCDDHLSGTVRALETYRAEHGRYPETLWSIPGEVRQGLAADGGPWPTRIHEGPVYVYEPIEDGRSYVFGVWACYARPMGGGLAPFLTRCLTLTGPDGAPSSLPADLAERVFRPTVRERPTEDDTFRTFSRIGIGGGVGEFHHRLGGRGRWAFWSEWPGAVPYSAGRWKPWWWRD